MGITFLNICIYYSGFKMPMYRKPTFTGFCSKFSFIPHTHERNLVNIQLLHFLNLGKLSFIRILLLYKNGFHKYFTDSYISKTLNIINSKHSDIKVEIALFPFHLLRSIQAPPYQLILPAYQNKSYFQSKNHHA